jgi:two-component system chemotaxis response regulator CheB
LEHRKLRIFAGPWHGLCPIFEKGAYLAANKIIVFGGSSGAIEALIEIVRRLPREIPAALFVGVHVSPKGESVLPNILSRAGTLLASHAVDGTPIRAGHIYVAPPDFHLLLKSGLMRLSRGPRENNHRPAIDPLFRSAAASYGANVIGVLLSGNLDDGTAGLLAIKQRGGMAVVQDPNDAQFPDMPRGALSAIKIDYALPAKEIGPLLSRLAHEPVKKKEERDAPPEMKEEIAIEEMGMAALENNDKPGKSSVFGCPDCGGTLWELDEKDVLRFRCRVGHAYTADSLAEQQTNGVEAAMWSALRALEESATLQRRIADRARDNKHEAIAARFEAKAVEAEDKARIVRDAIAGHLPGEVANA